MEDGSNILPLEIPIVSDEKPTDGVSPSFEVFFPTIRGECGFGWEKGMAMVLGCEANDDQASPIVGPMPAASSRIRCLEKTGRDCESRPNAPPTWGRFDERNIA